MLFLFGRYFDNRKTLLCYTMLLVIFADVQKSAACWLQTDLPPVKLRHEPRHCFEIMRHCFCSKTRPERSLRSDPVFPSQHKTLVLGHAVQTVLNRSNRAVLHEDVRMHQPHCFYLSLQKYNTNIINSLSSNHVSTIAGCSTVGGLFPAQP